MTSGTLAVREPGRGAVIYHRRGEIDAIDAYCGRLVAELNATGVAADYFANGISDALSRCGERPAWILLQYNPFAYGRGGVAPMLVRDVRRLRARFEAPLMVMVHEAWIDLDGTKSAAIGISQRLQLRAVLRYADRVLTSTEALALEIGRGAVHIPVGSNIPPTSMPKREARRLLNLDDRFTVALFGRSNPSRALDYAEEAIAAVAQELGPEQVAALNIGAGAPAMRVPAGVEMHQPGALPAEAVSLHLTASDLVLLPFTDGMSTRRSTLMAALAHGRPVLGLRSERTDSVLAHAAGALVLSPVGDRRAYAQAAAELSQDHGRLQAIGAAGRALYESRFDWPVITRRITSELRTIASPRPGRVVFVANDVGGPGGMERHTEQLIKRVLDHGTDVTVVARTCTLEPRAGLRFRRVPTPRRPFVAAYPAFFVVASLIAARERGTVLHTTGAIIANRAGLSTVHYCHRAAQQRVLGSRASRAGLHYRLNELVAGIMSRGAESWCYRPSRTQLLCAVSGGVAEELRLAFPAMSSALRTVPNGVDAAAFRPDPSARETLRAPLGVAADERLALFVGGDWERKGLATAISALATAPCWHLVVAGRGDEESMLGLARAAGVERRLWFLGSVKDMPRVYAAVDAFVLPTSYEAFPLVALEAAASALPLLVTRVNGVQEMLDDGRNGWFITRQAQDISRRLNQLSADPELASSMAAAARATALAYSWDAMAESYLSLYRELSHEPGSAGNSLSGSAGNALGTARAPTARTQ